MASGIADYSYELLPRLAEHAEVVVVSPRPSRFRRSQAPPGIQVVTPDEFRGRDGAGAFDAAFFHLANNPFHEFVYELFLDRPGIAVFHETVLHHFLHHATREVRPDHERYRAMLRADYGGAGDRLANLRERGIASDFEKFLFPLTGHVARQASGIVVHSEHAREQILDALTAGPSLSGEPHPPVTVIPHYAPKVPASVAGLTMAEARRRLGLPPDAFLAGHFGFITLPKQPGAVVGGFAKLAERRPEALLLMVGADHSGGVFRKLVESQGLGRRVRTAGYLDLAKFHVYLRAVDAMVNLRYPSAGESSGTVARALEEGRATIVNRTGSFAHIPDDVALKVELDADQTEQVGAHLIRLAEDSSFRAGLEERARSYASTELDAGRAARRYLGVAERAAATTGRTPHRPRLALRTASDTAPAILPIGGASDPRGADRAMDVREEHHTAIEWMAARSIPPAGGAVQLDLLYRLILRRADDLAAIRSAQLALATGEATRADLIRWMVESREFREIELAEKVLAQLRREPKPFHLGEDYPAENMTERVVEIPWVLSRWSGEQAVLDLGYANSLGYYLTALTGLPIDRLHGIDWAPGYVPGMLRTRADLRAMPYRDGAFDLVICVSTIEHIGLDNSRYEVGAARADAGDAATIREVERVLGPGGRLLITVPFGLAENQSWFVQYDRRRFAELVANTSLEVREQEIYHLTDSGWRPAADVEVLEKIPYAQNAPAARGVLCADLVKPAGNPR
jgi:glycosyltransferase involved in cell wall biosynthesis